ncbi:hypothetical protein V5735_04495 (plasmid) [Haladaptatus sp. SPP-AMP-3]|uniref:hypothetical protein n=1 Tax=Haladaptatus sp. SPP-AMP-3 TaxID=3121295 RepID=UPI003C2C9602
MSNSNARSALRPERPLLVAAVLLTVLVTAWLFVPTMLGHVATMNVGSVDVTTSGATVTDGGQHLTTTLTIHNPTRRDIVFYSGLIHVYDGETQLTDGTTTPLGETTVPARETVTLQVEIDLNPDRTARAKRAIRSGSATFSGNLRGRIGEKGIRVPVHTGGTER